MVTGNEFNKANFSDVLFALKDNIMRNLNTTDLAIVREIGAEYIKCELLNHPGVYIECLKIGSAALTVGSMVVVFYTNEDSRLNVKKFSTSQPLVDVNNKIYHSKNYGIIMSIETGSQITVDDHLDTSSTNPVQNKVIANKINDIESDIDNIGGEIDNISIKFGSDVTGADEDHKAKSKAYIDSSIENMAARFMAKDNLGNPFNTYAEFSAAVQSNTFYYIGQLTTPTNNDYTVVLNDETHIDPTTGIARTSRYAYNTDGTIAQWRYQYPTNTSGFTAAQWASITSGITAALVQQISKMPTHLNDVPGRNTRPVNNAADSFALTEVVGKVEVGVAFNAVIVYVGQPHIQTYYCQLEITSVSDRVYCKYTDVNLIPGSIDGLDGGTLTGGLETSYGEIKSFKCSHKGNTNNADWYFPVAKLPIDNSGNYASAIVNGRIGGWTANDMSQFSALVWQRGNYTGTQGAVKGWIIPANTKDSALNTADLVLYYQSDLSAILYVKCHGYYTFDFDVSLYQSTCEKLFNGTYVTTPSGTLSPNGTFKNNAKNLLESNSVTSVDGLSGGTITSATKINGNITSTGAFHNDTSEAALRFSDSNELSLGSNSSVVYIGYSNRIGSSGSVSTYKIGRHAGSGSCTGGDVQIGSVVIGNGAASPTGWKQNTDSSGSLVFTYGTY